MLDTPKLDLYLGSVHEVKDRVTYEITADIPGVAQEVRAYPYSRGEMDEPVEGNLIYLLSIDPVYHSVFLYTKAKENDFIGIRSNGKLVDITPDYITIGVYDTSTTSPDDTRPDPSKSYLKMDSSGNIEIMATGNEKIEIKGDSEVKVSGNVNIEVSGDANIKVSGNTTLDSPNVNVTGGNLTTSKGGSVSPTGNGGFNCLPQCIFSGVIHQGNKISGT